MGSHCSIPARAPWRYGDLRLIPALGGLLSAGFVAAVSPVSLLASTGSYFVVSKASYYEQNSSSAPALNAAVPYSFLAEIENLPTLPVSASSYIAPPTGATGAIGLVSFSAGYRYTNGYANQAALDAAFPNGTYTFHINTSSGGYVVPLALSPESYPVNIPTILNSGWASGDLVVNPTQSYTFTWRGFSGFHLNFGIQGNGTGTFNGAAYSVANPVTGNASYTLAANTLTAGQTYQATLEFDTATSVNTTGVTTGANHTTASNGIAAFGDQTSFTILAQTPGSAGTLVWNAGTDASGNWNATSVIWGTGAANSAWVNGSVAAIGNGGTAGIISITSSGISAGGITFNAVSSASPGQYTLAGSGSNNLSLTGAGTATMNSDATISASLVGTGGLTVVGMHNLTLAGTNTYTGPTSINSGELTLVTGGAINGTSALNISPGAVLTMNAIGSNDGLTIHYAAGTSPNSTIRNEIITGYNNGAWNGASTLLGAINSTVAGGSNHKYAIGYADGADGVVSGLATGNEKLMLTIAGDAALAGRVNLNDFTILISHYGMATGAQWDQGDFNYDGKVNLQDFTIFLNNYGQSLGTGLLPAVAVRSGFTRSVPEPESLAFLALGATLLLLRRGDKSLLSVRR